MPCERKHIEAIEKASDNLEAMCDDCQYGHASVLGRVMLDRAISAALDACDESPWRSMESAPKTEPILAVVDGDVRVVRYGKTSHVPLYGWCTADMGPEDCDLCDPTHWMPLPAAPEAARTGEDKEQA